MKRILMMLALAAFLVAALSVSALSAFAVTTDTQCKNGNKNCTVKGPGKSEDSNAVNGGNPNITNEFKETGNNN